MQIIPSAPGDATNYLSQVEFVIAFASPCFVYLHVTTMEKKKRLAINNAMNPKIVRLEKEGRCTASSNIVFAAKLHIKRSF